MGASAQAEPAMLASVTNQVVPHGSEPHHQPSSGDAPSSAGISQGVLRSLSDAKKLRLTPGDKGPGRG